MPNTHSTLTGLFGDIADAIRAKTMNAAPIVADNFPAAIAAIPTGGGGGGYVEQEGPEIPAAWKSLYVQALGRFRESFPSAAFTNVAFVTQPATAAGLPFSALRVVFMASGFAVTGRSGQSAEATGCWCVSCDYEGTSLVWDTPVNGSATAVTFIRFLRGEAIAWCSTIVHYDGVILYPVQTPTHNHGAADISGGGTLTYTLDADSLDLYIYVSAANNEEVAE